MTTAPRQRLHEDLSAFEDQWEATRRRQMLATLQPRPWKKLAMWACAALACLLLWAAILRGAFALATWLAGRF
mgnify:CR=1 FL=1